MAEDPKTMTLEEAIDIVATAAGRHKQRLARGAIRRQQMAADLAEGKEISGPRADWLRDTGQRVMDVLVAASKEFNDVNQDDMISNIDFQDVLTTCLGRLVDAAEQG